MSKDLNMQKEREAAGALSQRGGMFSRKHEKSPPDRVLRTANGTVHTPPAG